MEDIIDRKTGKVDAPFATYEHQATLSDRTLTITTSYTQNAGIYDAALFADYIKLYKRLAADAQSKLVLKKKA